MSRCTRQEPFHVAGYLLTGNEIHGMSKSIVLAIAAVLLCSVLQVPGTARADSTAASPSPSPAASASPDVMSKTIDIEGSPVTLHDIAIFMAEAMTVYLPLKDPHPTAVFVSKPQSDMPKYAPSLYYAGNALKDGQPVLTIWASNDLNGKTTLGAMQMAAVLGLLDAGQGGAAIQAIYVKERTADMALGANESDPLKNRRDMAASLVAVFDAILSSDPATPIKLP